MSGHATVPAPIVDAILDALIRHRDNNDTTPGSYTEGVDYAVGVLRDYMRFGVDKQPGNTA